MIAYNLTERESTDTSSRTSPTRDTPSRVKVPHIGPRPRNTKPVIPSGSNRIPLVNIKK